jgi:hypothetical protein
MKIGVVVGMRTCLDFAFTKYAMRRRRSCCFRTLRSTPREPHIPSGPEAAGIAGAGRGIRGKCQDHNAHLPEGDWDGLSAVASDASNRAVGHWTQHYIHCGGTGVLERQRLYLVLSKDAWHDPHVVSQSVSAKLGRYEAHSKTEPDDVRPEFAKTPAFTYPGLIRIVAVKR